MLGWLNVVYRTAVEQSQSTFHFNYHEPTHTSWIAYISVLVKEMASSTTASLQSNVIYTSPTKILVLFIKNMLTELI